MEHDAACERGCGRHSARGNSLPYQRVARARPTISVCGTTLVLRAPNAARADERAVRNGSIGGPDRSATPLERFARTEREPAAFLFAASNDDQTTQERTT